MWASGYQVEKHQHSLDTNDHLTKICLLVDAIHHLNDIVELRVLKIIQDGGAKRSSVYSMR